jgi:tetratricopeptide (TPR) repeat protein
MQEEMRRYAARLRERGATPVEARLGVNTGEVVVRLLPTGEGHLEYTPIGHSTSLAARMQALAPTGSIAVTQAVENWCRGYFIFKPLGPTRVRGVSEPIDVYEVTGLGPLRTRLQRAAGRGLTKFVGREREMEALRHAADLAKSGHGQIVAAMAEPGVGKSRLFYEFKVTARLGWMVLEAFSVSHGKASAYLPVLEMLSHYFDISRDDEDRKRRELILGKVLGLDRTLDDTLPYLYLLYGIAGASDSLAQMDAQIRLRRTLEAIKRIMLRESVNQPVMVIFEDLHWIDEQTQEFLNLLVDSIGTARILLLVNYRTEYSHQWNSKTYYTQLRLDPLAHESAEEMLDALLGGNPKLIPLKRLIIEKTEGTPFFMEEMVLALFEEGALYRNGVVGLTRPLTQIRVPASVQAVLASRIDRLPADEKDLLQILAVLGREFQLGVVQRVAEVPGDDLSLMLARLQSGEFIYEQPVAGDIEYTFKHALTQEVAYNSMLTARRRLLHERAGQVLESLFADQPEKQLTQLAYHYSHSADVKRALHYLQRAAQQAVQRSANAEAIIHLESALKLLETLPDSAERSREELALQLALTVPVSITEGGGSPQAEHAFKRARELCQQLEDTGQLAPLLWGLFIVYLSRAEHTTARAVAEELRRLGENANDSRILLWAHHALGSNSCWLGEFSSALDHERHSLTIYDSRHYRSYILEYGQDPRIGSLSIAALVSWILGYPDQALSKTRETRTLARELSHPWSIGFALFFAAFVHRLRGEVAIAQELAEAVIALCSEQGIPYWLTFATAIKGGALAAQGRAQEGIRQIQEGLEASRNVGSTIWS